MREPRQLFVRPYLLPFYSLSDVWAPRYVEGVAAYRVRVSTVCFCADQPGEAAKLGALLSRIGVVGDLGGGFPVEIPSECKGLARLVHERVQRNAYRRWSVGDLAVHFDSSTRTLERVVKRAGLKPLRSLLNDALVATALRMREVSDPPWTVTAHALGFPSVKAIRVRVARSKP
jgi:hypothetical protein